MLYAGDNDIAKGKNLWQERGYPGANVIWMGERSLLLDENGKLTLARMNRKGLKVLAEASLLQKPARTAPTVDGTRVYLRDQKVLIALDLGKDGTKQGP